MDTQYECIIYDREVSNCTFSSRICAIDICFQEMRFIIGQTNKESLKNIKTFFSTNGSPILIYLMMVNIVFVNV